MTTTTTTMTMSGKPSCSVPHGWANCPARSSLIADKFVVCKTFLGGHYDGQVAAERRFTFKTLKDSVETDCKRTVGMVVDLTNTNRFYGKWTVKKDGCRWVKIACKGYGECPSTEEVNSFRLAVQDFVGRNPGGVVCVHCTHGFNRSGFMIVSYLCDVMKIDLKTSVDMFSSARAPGIHKPDYLAELTRRYGGAQLDVPALPEWKAGHDVGTDEPMKKKKKTFMDGMIQNVDMVTDVTTTEMIQATVNNMCGWRGRRFPGSQPVSMDVDNINNLISSNYKVTWKADGQRFMMLIKGASEVYMLDRDFVVFKVNTKFPRRMDRNEHVCNTLLDGEMVLDKYNDIYRGRYLVYDVIRFEGQDVYKMNLDDRLECIAKEVVGPRTVLFQRGQLDKRKEPFSISAKDFWDVTAARSLLDGAFHKTLLHDSDGLVFQPVDDAYRFGQCRRILKWKAPELNSVDFLLRIEKQQDDKPVGKLMVGGKDEPFSRIEITDQLVKYEDKIIECNWNFESKSWNFMRERTDKSFPNKLETAQSIVRSIDNPVTKERLYQIIDTSTTIPKSCVAVATSANRKRPRKAGTPQKDYDLPFPTYTTPRDPLGLSRDDYSHAHKRRRLN